MGVRGEFTSESVNSIFFKAASDRDSKLKEDPKKRLSSECLGVFGVPASESQILYPGDVAIESAILSWSIESDFGIAFLR